MSEMNPERTAVSAFKNGPVVKKKKNLILTQRDIKALEELYHHRAASSSQLARLSFPNISYETARKRLRRLQQAGFMGSAASGRMEGRGRPELIYFLSSSGAKILEQESGISWENVPTGPPHLYHKEHFLRLVDLRLSMEDSQEQRIVESVQWSSGKEFWRELTGGGASSDEQADATLQFAFPGSDAVRVLIEMDTGNFRQHRHWEPKIRSFLKLGHPIWVITGALPRILTLSKWTAPLLEESGTGPGHCLFAVFQEILKEGVFGSNWYRTDGSTVKMGEYIEATLSSNPESAGKS